MAWTAPRTWTTGELVTAALVNAHLRDNLLETAPAKVTTAGDLVYASGASALSRLGVTAGYALRGNDGGSAPAYDRAPFVLDVSTSQADFTNSTTETSVYDSPTIAASKLGTVGGLRLTIAGDLLKNATGTLQLRVKLGPSGGGGPTTVLTTNVIGFTNNAGRHNWNMTVVMLLAGTHNSQKWLAHGTIGDPGTDLYASLVSATDAWLIAGYITSAIATNVDVILRVTADWSAADVALSFRKELAVLEWWK